MSGSTTISSGGGLADRYAAALYWLASDEHALDQVVEQMDALGRLIDASAVRVDVDVDPISFL